MIKNFRLALIKFCIAFFLLAIVNSCKKDQDVGQNQNDPILKENILAYLDIQKNRSIESGDFIDTLKKSARWNETSVFKINSMEMIVYVPVSYNSNSTGLVFIINTKNNIFETAYLSEITNKFKVQGINHIDRNVIAPSVIINNFYNYKMGNFSGSIKAYSLYNTHLWEMGYDNGINIYKKKVFAINNATTSGNVQIKKSSGTISDNIIKKSNDCVAYYLVTYWSDGTADYLYIGGYCTSPCQLNIAISNDSTIRIKSTCTGGVVTYVNGGGSSILKDVKNGIKDPCLKNIVNQFITGGTTSGGLTNVVSDILTNVFGFSNKVNITFLESNNIMLSDNSGPAEAKTIGDQVPNSNGVMNETVYLNTSLLSSTSQEYKASVIIHELIHASLNISVGQSPSAGVAYDQFLQHEEMLRSYIDKMSAALVDFYPSLPFEAARSLSLQGLGTNVVNSTAFTNLVTSPLYGFNTNNTSRYFWGFNALQYQVGDKGTICNSSNGTPKI
ncbi:MAG: hypothetical protein WCG67_01480 [Ferruginibacter sp.]